MLNTDFMGTVAEWCAAILSGIAIIMVVWQSKKQKKIDYELEYSKVRPFFMIQFGRMICNKETEVLFFANSKDEKENIIEVIGNNIEDSIEGDPNEDNCTYSIPAISIINVNEYSVLGVKVIINNKKIDKIKLKTGEYIIITDTSMVSSTSGSIDEPIDFPYETVDIYLTTVRREQMKLSYIWDRQQKCFDYNKTNSKIGNKIDIDKEIYRINEFSNTYTFNIEDIEYHEGD